MKFGSGIFSNTWLGEKKKLKYRWMKSKKILCFANDITLFAYNIKDIKVMLQDLQEVCFQVWIQINISKTKLITSGYIFIDNCNVKFVEKNTYIDHEIWISIDNHSFELTKNYRLLCRLMQTYDTYSKARLIF